MEVPGERNLFVIGCFEKRVTLLSQQVRALNLVFALHTSKRLRAGSKVAVVGAGAAGMTAAIAAARLGCEVTLLEKKEALLPLLRGNTTRWLHPHIYDWPHEGSERNEAGLPLLTWKAALAGDVAIQLEDAWKASLERSRIQTFFNVISMDVSLGNQGGRRFVSWNSPGSHDDTFDAVLLTVGFGLERKVEGIQWNSYWDNDHLHQHARDGNERHLISGCGDGGLVELLRVRLRDFRHEQVLESLLNTSSLGPLKRKLLEVEEQARQDADPEAFLVKEYRSLPIPGELDEAISGSLRKDKSAVLNGRGARSLTLQSSILNRLLVSRLLFRFDVPYRPGEFTHVSQGDMYKVQFKTGKPESFHRIICRHGPLPGALEEEFPEIWGKCQKVQARSELDQTRWPIWPRGFFGAEPDGDERPAAPAFNSPFGTPHEQATTGTAPSQAKMPAQEASTPKDSSAQGITAAPGSRSGSAVNEGEQPQEVNSKQQPNEGEPSGQERQAKPASQKGAPDTKKTGQSLSAGGVILGLVLVWFVFLKDRPEVDSGKAPVVRVPSNLKGSPPEPGLVKGGARKIGNGAGSPKAPESSPPGGDVILAGGATRTPQQLRSLHRVRPLQQGEETRLLESLPVGVFGFVDPTGPILSEQVRVTSQQASKVVEVHKLTDGQLHLVGYVWDVESRAIGTGRPVTVQLSPQPFGRSQNLVSIPFGRIRGAFVKNEQGQFMVGLELGSSSEM